MTVDAIDAPSTAGAPPPSDPNPNRVRAFARRHPWLTALYSFLVFLGVLILALVIFLWTANWNMLRGPIGRYVSAQTHRHVEIDGDLKVHLLTWTPTVTIGDLKVGNPDWAGPGDTADVDRIVVSVKFWPLLTGHVVMPILEFDKPVLNLFRDKTGRQSWDLGPSKPNAKPFKLPPIQRFVVNDGHMKYVDLKRNMSITGVIDSNERATGFPGPRLQPRRARFAEQKAVPVKGRRRTPAERQAEPALSLHRRDHRGGYARDRVRPSGQAVQHERVHHGPPCIGAATWRISTI